MARHMQSSHGGSKFNCDQCDKKFGRADKFKAHLRMHDKEVKASLPAAIGTPVLSSTVSIESSNVHDMQVTVGADEMRYVKEGDKKPSNKDSSSYLQDKLKKSESNLLRKNG
jgi:hypothetical protein